MQAKRDMDLIRELLLKLETLDNPAGGILLLDPKSPEMAIQGYDAEQVEYHLGLIKQKGLIDSPGSQPMFGVTFRGITWTGHDFLDSIRDPEIWKMTKEGALVAGGFTMELLMSLAKGLVKKKVEDYTGIKL